MANIILPATPDDPIPTFKRLDEIVAILGDTKMTFFPLIEDVGGFGGNDLPINYRGSLWHAMTARNAAGSIQISPGMSPVRHVGGICSYKFESVVNRYLRVVDSPNFSFGNGSTTDAAFSLGLWILPAVITNATLMAKWDVEAGLADREWKLALDGSSRVEVSLYDDDANGSEVGVSDTALPLLTWSFIVVTYDGAQDDPGVTFYLNGAADGSGTVETGSYASMQAGGEALTIGAHLDGNTPAGEYDGRLALPFLTGKELTQNDISNLHSIGQELIGLK